MSFGARSTSTRQTIWRTTFNLRYWIARCTINVASLKFVASNSLNDRGAYLRVIFNLFYPLLGSVYLRVIFNLFYILLGSVYLRATLNLSYTLLGSVYLRVTVNFYYTLLGSVYLRLTLNRYYTLLGSVYQRVTFISSISSWVVYTWGLFLCSSLPSLHGSCVRRYP